MTSALIEHLQGKDDAVVAYTSSVLGPADQYQTVSEAISNVNSSEAPPG